MQQENIYIEAAPNIFEKVGTMLGIERLFGKSGNNNYRQPGLPPNAKFLDYHPDLAKVTKEDLRRLMPDEYMRKEFENLTGVTLSEYPLKNGGLPKGAKKYSLNGDCDGKQNYHS